MILFIKFLIFISGHKSKVKCLKILPNGNIISGSSDGIVKIWDKRNFKCFKNINAHEKSAIECMEIYKNNYLLTGGR